MARSRRNTRRSTSRNAASLLALALPAPLQRLANSQGGPLLMFFGFPAMLVVGLLQIDWQNGAPHLKVNAEKASELREAVQGRLGNLENQPIVQQWEQTALDAWRSHQQSNPQQQYPQPQPAQPGSVVAGNPPSGWAPSVSTANDPYGSASGPAVRNSAAPFPSTNPPSSQYISTQTPAQAVATTPNYSRAEQPYSGQQSSGQQPNPQQNYSAQQYQQQPYSQQQNQQQQQLYQQQAYQQQLYQQQQYQQQPQQPPASPALPAHTPWQSR